MPELVVVSPKEALAHVLRDYLEPAGWTVRAFGSLTEATASAPTSVLTLLDMAAVPDPCAEATLPPRLFVLGDPGTRIPDTAITETFSAPARLGHLAARLQFHERLGQRANDASYPLGPFVFAPRPRTATHKTSHAVVRLTEKESALLDYLVSIDQPVPRDDILAAVWGYGDTMDTHTLETHLYRLRRKLATPEMDTTDLFLIEAGLIRIHPLWRHA